MKSAASRMLAAIAVLIFGALAVATSQAQGPQGPGLPQGPQGPPAQGQPDPGVARVSFIRGDVSMQRGDSGDTSAAILNTPLVAGDRVSTGDGSRVELQLDFANVLRLDERTQADVATLTQNRIQIQLAQGLASFSVLNGSEADVEIDTPNVAVHPLKPGRYRIQIDPSGDTFVTVREGSAEVSTPQGSTMVQKGDLITIRGAGSDAAYQTSRASLADDWDNWNRDRDNIISGAESYRHTNRYYTGAGDLDTYGSWGEVPDYGPVWVPRVGVDWAPYRAGRWVWEPYYGWTWVSYEPWGWAPYHYGRWLVYGGSWAWWPGPIYGPYRPVWAPAYVSFFGFGAGIGVGFGFGGGFGSIGWLPIGPGDYFHPWYGGVRDRFNAVNVTNVYNVHEGFAPLHPGDRFSNLRYVSENDRLREGVSSVSADRFGRGVVDSRPVSAADFRGGRALTGNLPVAPSRESLRTSDRNASAGAFSGRANSVRFFSRNAPASGSARFGGGQPGNGGVGGYRPPSREPLDLNRPIVRERSYSAPAYRGPANGRGESTVPAYRPAPSAPAYRGAPGGGSRPAPAPSYRGYSGGGNSSSGRGSVPTRGGSGGGRSGGSSSSRSRSR
jgi:hypothetical protein